MTRIPIMHPGRYIPIYNEASVLGAGSGADLPKKLQKADREIVYPRIPEQRLILSS